MVVCSIKPQALRSWDRRHCLEPLDTSMPKLRIARLKPPASSLKTAPGDELIALPLYEAQHIALNRPSVFLHITIETRQHYQRPRNA